MPSATIERGADTSEAVLHIVWTRLVTPTETGYSPILSYNLQYDQGSNTWVDVVGATEYYDLDEVFITAGVTPGT